jgi:hypothetical protein
MANWIIGMNAGIGVSGMPSRLPNQVPLTA